MDEMNIKTIYKTLNSPFTRSVNMRVKFKNGTKDSTALDLTSTIKAIILGKNEMNVSGVKALWASLNVFDLEAIAMHRPLIKKEYATMTMKANMRLGMDGISVTSL